ncbi:MAG: PQQ-dependent sugar dehydrogenase [Actinomycetota bacterium]|nr:PQQ-dependent sugar dehydrogenase [Actinomycetota bacterium]
MLTPLAVIAIAAALAACNGDESEEPARVDATPMAETTGDDPVRPAQSGVRLSRIGSFDQPTYVTAPPGDESRLFVTEQPGRIRVLVDGRKRSRPFLDIREDVGCCGERGLLSMAFAPDYADSGRFYVYFTARDGDIRVQQFRRSAGNADVADRGSRRNVIRIEHSRYGNHNGGQLQFGPDGMLYLGTGDGGGGGDPLRSGQSLRTLLGKLLRIDPREGGGYDVPGDNPFRGRSGARGEIWAYGLRNPYRFSFDRKGGALALGDVGQNAWDEIDWSRNRGRGANFGWSVYEANSRFRSGTARGHVRPVLAKRLGTNCATIGGYVVRDPRLTGLAGRYLHGDNCNPVIYSVRLSSRGASGNRSTGLRLSGLSSFGEDAAGRVYATSLNGGVYRLVQR